MPTGYNCQEKFLELFMDASIYLTQEAGSFVKNLHTNNKVSVKKKGELRNTRFENAIMDDPITNVTSYPIIFCCMDLKFCFQSFASSAKKVGYSTPRKHNRSNFQV